MIDKSGWGEGPWRHEPDVVEWRSGELYLLVTRHPEFGSLNGYVGVPPGHPWHGVGCDGIGAACHWGLTYAADAAGLFGPRHTPPGYWVVGFDCAHGGDLSPGMYRHRFGPSLLNLYETYRDFAYVAIGVVTLAGQAFAAAGVPLLPHLPSFGPGVADGVGCLDGIPVTGDGDLMVKRYVRGEVPLEILADWLADHADEVGLGGVADVWNRVTGVACAAEGESP